MIAIVYPQFYGVGEIVRYLDSFLESLPDGHPKVYLITGDKNRRIARYKGVEIINVPFLSNRFSLFLWALRVRKILLQLHKQKKIQWVNLHTPPLIPGLMLPKKIPLLLTVHGTYLGMSGAFNKVRYFESHWTSIEIQLKQLMEYFIFRRSAKTIVLNPQGQEEVLAYGYQKQITKISKGIDVDRFKPNPSVTKDIDVLFYSGKEFYKGHRAMVAVCKALIAIKSDIVICIIGDTSKGHSTEYIKNNENVILAGEVTHDEEIRFYQRSRVFASTSYYEGLTSSSIQAMAMALPVVVWDLLFYRNLVVDQETGVFVAVDDFQQMALQITRLLGDAANSRLLGNHARQMIVTSYSWKTISKQFFDILI